MAVKTYDLTNVFIFYGVFEIKGFAEDAAISLEHDEDHWSHQVGVDGEGTRSKTSNKSATLTVSLMQSSDSNDLLSIEAGLDEIAPGGTGGKALLIKDEGGSSVYAAESAWIQRRPTAEFNRDASVREWVIRIDNLIAFHGSN